MWKEEVERKPKCDECGYEWVPRVGDPKACPRCKSYDWNKSESPQPEPTA